MAGVSTTGRNFLLLVFFSSAIGVAFGGLNQPLTDDNWRRMLVGEWMVKFFAPWCPACRQVTSTWNSFALKAESLGIQVGDVDITKESSLSGRFIITSLPTIYHVRNGEFRKYEGPRSLRDFQEFVREQKWRETEPIAWWKSPSSIFMGFMGLLFKLSVALKEVHEWLTIKQGLPSWASYCIFGVTTVAVGLLLGLFIVFISDHLLGTRSAASIPQLPKLPADEKEKDDKDEKDENDKKDENEDENYAGDEGNKKDETTDAVRKRNVQVNTD